MSRVRVADMPDRGRRDDAPTGNRPHPFGPGRRDGLWLALTVGVALGAVFLQLSPLTPDFAAQLARAAAASRGADLWWAGWYGGVNVATYSLTSAFVMAKVGVGVLGVLSTTVVCVVGADLVRDSLRPRAGAIAVALAASSNLYSGRVTYAAGMAVTLASFCLLRRGRSGSAAALAALSGLVSPLAAVCEVVGLTMLLLTTSQHRRTHLAMMVLAAAPVAGLSLLFGQPSYMPFGQDVLGYSLLVCAGLALLAPSPQVRLLAALSAALCLGCWLVPSPIGSNAARTPMLAAAPLAIAFGRPSRRWGRVAVAGLIVWPLVTVSGDLADAAQPSSDAGYYQPLLARLPAAGTAVQRLEVLDPLSHAASYFLAAQVPVARGWERQIDAASNPLFYDGSLSSATYEDWLVTHAVGWVALPAADLDYGYQTEGALVATRPAYLHETWHSATWRLFRVVVPAPAATGPLVVTALQDHAVALTAHAAGTGLVRAAFSSLLVVRSDDDPTVTGCLRAAGPDSLAVTVPRPGRYHLLATLGTGHCSLPNIEPGAPRHVTTYR